MRFEEDQGKPTTKDCRLETDDSRLATENEKATPAKGRPLLSRENSSNGRQSPPKLSGEILWAEKGGCQGNFR
jgi:hypothetical protein